MQSVCPSCACVGAAQRIFGHKNSAEKKRYEVWRPPFFCSLDLTVDDWKSRPFRERWYIKSILLEVWFFFPNPMTYNIPVSFLLRLFPRYWLYTKGYPSMAISSHSKLPSVVAVAHLLPYPDSLWHFWKKTPTPKSTYRGLSAFSF